MGVKNVDVRRLQLLQAGFYAKVHRFDVIAGVEDLLLDLSLRAHVTRCVLCAQMSTASTEPMHSQTLVAMTS